MIIIYRGSAKQISKYQNTSVHGKKRTFQDFLLKLRSRGYISYRDWDWYYGRREHKQGLEYGVGEWGGGEVEMEEEKRMT